MNRLTLLLLLLLASTMLSAQSTPPPTYTVKGILIDSLTLEGEPYATIRIVRKSAPDKAVKMAVTDMKGSFEESIAGAGDYILTITSIGKTDVVREFTLVAGTPVYDFGTLHTAEATNELAGVEVVAQRPLVKVDIDKIEYNIEEDPDSKTNSLLEMLRKVPMVTVDGEDNIQVNGSSNFKVHVNGKPNNMMSDNPKEVLRSMPASSIKHIEVITDPGAKYDAEGVGGILNIVTVGGGGIEGYNLTLSGHGNNMGVGGSVYGTIKKGKFTVTGNYGYSYDDRPRNYSESSREDLKTGDFFKRTGTSKAKGSFQHGNVEASYEIDTLRLVTMAFGMYGGGSDSNGDEFTNKKHGEIPLYNYEKRANGDDSWFSIRGNIDYQRLFSVKDRMLTFSYRINSQPRTNDSYTNYLNKNVPIELIDSLDIYDRRTDEKMNTMEHTFQVDYVTPLAEYHTIETGAKYIIRNNKSDTKYYRTENEGQEEFDDKRSSKYRHLNDILAAYVGYTLRYKALSGKAGVRYEHTIQNVKYLDNGPRENFKKNFDDVVPNASIGYKLGQSANLRAGYNMRIWRPSIYYLNPYYNDNDPNMHSQGNPNLKSEKNHSFNLSFSSFTMKFNINLSLRHSFTNNSIESIMSRVDGNVLYSTYANIGKSRNTGLNAYVNWNASPNTRIYVNASGGYSDLRAESGDYKIKNNGWNLWTSAGIQHTFPLEIRASLNTYASTPWINLQGRSNSNLGYHFSLNRSFINKRLTVSAFAGNFLEKYRSYKNTVVGKEFVQRSSSKYQQRRFGVSISYRLGELKAQVKKAARSIENDDVKDGGGGGGEGGN